MGYPNMKCMYITIWVHHMQVDELFDYLTDRIDTAPPFWNNHEDCPHSVTGGYVAVNVDYKQFSKIRSMEDWETIGDSIYLDDNQPSYGKFDFGDWEDFVDED